MRARRLRMGTCARRGDWERGAGRVEAGKIGSGKVSLSGKLQNSGCGDRERESALQAATPSPSPPTPPPPIATAARGVSDNASPSLRENKDCFDGQRMSTGVSQCSVF